MDRPYSCYIDSTGTIYKDWRESGTLVYREITFPEGGSENWTQYNGQWIRLQQRANREAIDVMDCAPPEPTLLVLVEP